MVTGWIKDMAQGLGWKDESDESGCLPVPCASRCHDDMCLTCAELIVYPIMRRTASDTIQSQIPSQHYNGILPSTHPHHDGECVSTVCHSEPALDTHTRVSPIHTSTHATVILKTRATCTQKGGE